MSDTPVISLLHASKGRATKALQTMRLWAERCTRPEDVQYVFALESTDAETDAMLERELPVANLPWWNEGDVVAVRGNFGGSAPAWNAACKVSGGALLLQISDDLVCPQDWDTALLNRLPEQWETTPLVIAVNDGLRRDKLMTGAICTRMYADWKGEFLHPGFMSMYSDDDFTFRAYRDQQDGNCRVIEARDLLFEHQHHCKTNAEPDATYLWTGRKEAYEHGKKLFLERNPMAYNRDARLWL